MKQTKVKIFLCVVCLLITAGLFFSFTVLLVHACHDCAGDGCEVCLCLQSVKNLLRNLFSVPRGHICGLYLACASVGAAGVFRAGVLSSTPVALRVRMNA